MVLDTSTAAAVLKTYYSNQRVTSLTYKDAPLYAMLDKVKDFFGSSYPLPMRVTNPQGRSATFTNAQNQKKESNYKTFSLTRVRDYSLASISTEAILASENDAGAFLRLATAEIDGALDSMRRSISWSLYGDGSGALGQVASSDNTANSITLTNVEDISKIEVGQTLVVWSAASGGSQRNYDGTNTTLTVKSVDRDAGSFATNEDITSSKTIAANDYIFVSGDRGAKLSGLAAWIPSTAPTSGDSFFSVDRSVDATRLAGVRITSTGKPADEALVDAARRMGREGANPDTVMTNFGRYASLEKTLGAKVRYKDVEVAGIAFRGIEVSGPKRAITVLPDADCPANLQYMLTMDTLALYSLKEPIMLLDQDGNKMLRESTADAHEVRVGGYFNFGCVSPRDNGVLIY
jgi:hypothetical protein